jgi:hypothetical protein
MIEIDDDLISKMIENTLKIGVYGKVEQKKRLAANNLSNLSPRVGEGIDK